MNENTYDNPLHRNEVRIPPPNWFKHKSVADASADMLKLASNINCHIGYLFVMVDRELSKPEAEQDQDFLSAVDAETSLLAHITKYLVACVGVYATIKPSLESFPAMMYASTCLEESVDWLDALTNDALKPTE